MSHRRMFKIAFKKQFWTFGLKNECEEEKKIFEEAPKRNKENVDAVNEVLEINSQKWIVMKCVLNVNVSFEEFFSSGWYFGNMWNFDRCGDHR